jgi:hypothetical protein
VSNRSAYLSVTDVIKRQENEEQVIKQLVEKLNSVES